MSATKVDKNALHRSFHTDRRIAVYANLRERRCDFDVALSIKMLPNWFARGVSECAKHAPPKLHRATRRTMNLGAELLANCLVQILVEPILSHGNGCERPGDFQPQS